MNAPINQQIEDLFLKALDVPPSELDRFLNDRCGDNERLKEGVLNLLRADAQADGGFLDSALFASAESSESDGKTQPIKPRDLREAKDSSTHAARFDVLASHQAGGLGEVLVAYDRQLKREVAIKQIKPQWQQSEEARQRFLQEAEVTGRLEHPGVVPVYAMGTWQDGRDYYAMRFIEGRTLGEAIESYHDAKRWTETKDKRPRAVAFRHLLQCFVDVCNTVQYAHSRRILHRDIKPSNIMVGPYGETLVVDWGLAKLLDESNEPSMTEQLVEKRAIETGSTPTRVGGTVGSPQYMSPEQAECRLDEIGIRTDVYLLGATLYQILTGQPPHQGDSIKRLMKQISDGQFPRPREIQPSVPPAMESICLKAMATDPADRYRSVQQMAQDVERWMADEPVSSHRDSLLQTIGRWTRHHRTATVSITVAVVLMLLGSVIGVLAWNAQRVREFQVTQQRDAERLQREQEVERRIEQQRFTIERGDELAKRELRAGRYRSALNVLMEVQLAIPERKELQSERATLSERAERIARIVQFYDLADEVQEQNVLSRDTRAMIACYEALNTLGIARTNDWWAHLPTEDLSAVQVDQLVWDVYQQWMLMDAMLTKTIAVRLAGSDGLEGTMDMLRAIERFLRTDAGKREASAALIVSDRVDRFRSAESTKYYRSVAQMRLGMRGRMAAADLGFARNGADSHGLGVLSMLAALDPAFGTFFRGYSAGSEVDDPLLVARDLFRRGATLRPDHYWTHLALAQVEYLLAARMPNPTWRDYDAAVHTIGQCISLNPKRCFAYADRSSIYRAQARLIDRQTTLPRPIREQRVEELLGWSLKDARTALSGRDRHPWVGWQYGLALMEIGQIDQAIAQFQQTSLETLSLATLRDVTVLDVDDLRGRNEAAQQIATLTKQQPERADLSATLAMIRLTQNRVQEALEVCQNALNASPDSANANATMGILSMLEGEFESALESFNITLKSNPQHAWAIYGIAHCNEQLGNLSESLSGYRDAFERLTTNENRAAALMGQCRIFALKNRFEESELAMRLAREAEPACDIMEVVRPLATHYQTLKRSSSGSEAAISLKRLLQSFSGYSRVTSFDFGSSQSRPGSLASLLNGGFELESMRYWQASDGAAWSNSPGSEAVGAVDRKVAHTGSCSLRISNSRENANGASGRSGQEFLVDRETAYELVAWARSESLGDDAAKLLGPNGQTVIQFPAGNHPWRRWVGRIEPGATAAAGAQAASSFTPCKVEIVMSGTGTIWLDDIQVRAIPPDPARVP